MEQFQTAGQYVMSLQLITTSLTALHPIRLFPYARDIVKGKLQIIVYKREQNYIVLLILG